MIVSALIGWLVRRLAEEPDARIVAAVSGGADSCALGLGLAASLRAIGRRPGQLLVFAHYNHLVRDPAEHERDLATVRALANRCEVALATERAQAGAIAAAATAAGGVEAAARSLRYDFLERASRTVGARTLCVAHHADDQAETVLMRMLAGQTGARLAGIPRTRRLESGVLLCRPLLDVRRADIRAFLTDRDAEWNEDTTNSDSLLRRNRVRNEILPSLRSYWPAVDGDLFSLSVAMSGVRDRLRRYVDAVPVTISGTVASVGRRDFFAMEPEARLELLYRLLGRLGLLEREDRPGHRFFEPALRRDSGANQMLIQARGISVELAGTRVVIGGHIVRQGESGYLRVVVPNALVDAGEGWTIWLAADSGTAGVGSVLHLNRIRRPVVVRTHRPGDCVPGAGRNRSVASVLAAMGVPRELRRSIPVLVDRDGIVAVLGSVLGYRDVSRGSTMKDGPVLVVQSRLGRHNG